MYKPITVKEKLKYLRSQNNFTQKQVANAVGITERAYQHYEEGTRTPKDAILEKLAGLFNVPVTYLYGNSSLLAHTAHVATFSDISQNKEFADKLQSLKACFDNYDTDSQSEASMLIIELINSFCIDDDDTRNELLFKLRNTIDFYTKYYKQRNMLREMTQDDSLTKEDETFVSTTNKELRTIKSIIESQAGRLSDLRGSSK